jgi:hypothetical protein
MRFKFRTTAIPMPSISTNVEIVMPLTKQLEQQILLLEEHHLKIPGD